MKHIRLMSLACLVVAAASAHAFNIAVQSLGTVTSAELSVFTESVTFQSTSVPLPVFTDVNYWIVNVAPPASGMATLSNGSGDSIDLDLTLQAVTDSVSTVSGVGNWAYVSGTGAYANLAGSGTFAYSIDVPSAGSFSSFVGKLNAVPEPASLALIGMGVTALAVRRARKSA